MSTTSEQPFMASAAAPEPAPQGARVGPDVRVGVMIPTYRRPDLARACVLQWLMQSLPPAVICVHQNGSEPSYEWCVEDLLGLGTIEWLHSPGQLLQQEWYGVPLRRLLARGCTHFFWADHDDLYLRGHAEQCVSELRHADFTVASHCAMLTVSDNDYRFQPLMHFTAHAGGGMSSSMAFTRAFAERLADDFARDTVTQYADNVLALTTLPHFTRHTSARRTTVYVSHRGSLTSAAWVNDAFDDSIALPPTPASSASTQAESAIPWPGGGPVLYGTRDRGYRDITRRVIAFCRKEGDAQGYWPLPEGDIQRSHKFGDPALNEIKHLVLCGLPDAQGLLVDRVLRDSDHCTFRFWQGVLSAECRPA